MQHIGLIFEQTENVGTPVIDAVEHVEIEQATEDTAPGIVGRSLLGRIGSTDKCRNAPDFGLAARMQNQMRLAETGFGFDKNGPAGAVIVQNCKLLIEDTAFVPAAYRFEHTRFRLR